MTSTNDFATKVQRSREAGASDEEIANFLSEKDPVFGEKYLKSKAAGASATDVFSYLGAPSMEQKQPIQETTSQEPKSFLDQLEQGFENVKNKAGRLGLMAAKGVMYAQPSMLLGELSGQLHGSTPVQAERVRETATRGRELLEARKAKGQLSPEEEKRLQEYTAFENISNEEYVEHQKHAMEEAPEFIKNIIEQPTPMGLIRAVGKEVGIDIDAKDTLEKFTEFTTMLASGRPDEAVANTWKFAKPSLEKMSPKMANLTNKAMKSAAVVAPAAALEETTGMPMEYSLLLFGAGQAGYQAAKAGISWAGKKWAHFDPTNLPYYNPSKFKEAVQKELARAPEYVEEKLTKGILKAKDLETLKPLIEKADELGIPVTPNILVNSKYFKEVQKVLRDTEMTQSEMIQFKQKVAQDWADLTKKSLKEVQTNLEFSTPGSTAEALMSDVTKAQHNKLVSEYTEGYQKSAAELKNSENIVVGSYREIEDSINGVVGSIGETIFETSAQTAAKQIGKEAKAKLTTSAEEANLPSLGDVRLETGKQAKGKAVAKEAQEVKKSTKEAAMAKRKLEKEQQKARKKKTKPAKARAQEKVAEAQESAEQSKEALREKFKESIGNVKKAEQKQKQTFLRSQEDLEDFFGESAQYMRLGENGEIRIVKPINGSVLVNSVQSLGKIIDWDNPAIVNLYKGTRKTLQNIIKKEYGVSNPNAIKNLEQANLKFAQTQHLFGKQSKWKKWGIDSESTSEELLSTINSVDKLKRFEKDFGTTPKGKEYIQHLKYLKAKEILEPIFDMRDFTPGNVANSIHKLKRNDYFRHLVPENTWSNLEQIGKLDALIEQRSKTFFSGPVEKQDLNAFTGFVNWAKKYSIHVIDTASKNRRASVYANYFLDPKYTNTSKELLTKISNEMAKPKPDIGKLNKWRAYYDMNMNNLVQYSKIKSISEETTDQD